MAYQAKIVLDSKCSETGCRLTTFELTYPRFVHAEFMTHRLFSRNASSSRAIPIDRMIQRVLDDPALPIWWGKNQAGMQAWEELEEYPKEEVKKLLLAMRDAAVGNVYRLKHYGLHKQIANRYLEPWMWITVICSGTDIAYTNFFHLRTDKHAQPEIKKIADLTCDLYYSSTPDIVPSYYWHMPYIREEDEEALSKGEIDIDQLKRVSAARCARVSYLNHDGVRNLKDDLILFDRLTGPGHWSPLEHIAQAQEDSPNWSGNFFGWSQFRKEFSNECVRSFTPITQSIIPSSS